MLKPRPRTNITTLLNKKIVYIEVKLSGCNTYYRFYTSKKNFFDVHVNEIFDKDGNFFADDLQIPFPGDKPFSE